MDFRRSGRQFRGIQKRRKESSGNVKIKSLRNNANLIPKQNEYTYLSDEGSLKNENRCSTWVQKEEEVERRAEEKKWRYRPLDSIVWERCLTLVLKTIWAFIRLSSVPLSIWNAGPNLTGPEPAVIFTNQASLVYHSFTGNDLRLSMWFVVFSRPRPAGDEWDL